MRVFVTGATGFIGMAVVRELIDSGHDVVGMTRSAEGARRLKEAGAIPFEARLEDAERLKRGAAAADGVIHLAFIHEFSDASLSARLGVLAGALTGKAIVPNFLSTIMRTDGDAIRAMGSALEGTGGPFVITVGTLGLPLGHLATEADAPDPASPGGPRSVPAETLAHELASRGVRTAIVRLPPTVHAAGDRGFIYRLSEIARKKGISAYLGDGQNRWPAVHRDDAAKLYRSIIERATPGETFHGVAEEGIAFREIAELIGARAGVPVASMPAADATKHFSFLASFVGADNPASSAITRKKLDWNPDGPSLLADIGDPAYTGIAAT